MYHAFTFVYFETCLGHFYQVRSILGMYREQLSQTFEGLFFLGFVRGRVIYGKN